MVQGSENDPPRTPKRGKSCPSTLRVPIDPFPTPRKHKSPSPAPEIRPTKPERWPRLKGRISLKLLADVTKELYGHAPYQWQLDLVEKVLEGRDCIAVAGTGSGKSLVFVMLALVAELVQGSGLVIVCSPLKALQKDQVRRFNRPTSFTSKHLTSKTLNLRAAAINEDNNDESIFKEIRKGAYRLIYASPECLLRSAAFKKLFREEEIRQNVVAFVIDEAHVVKSWAVQFRKDYAELEALRIIIGSEIPSLALTATCSTKTFETIHRALGMGQHQPFYGVDRGSNRPNIAQWVRPMEYPLSTLGDLLAFLPNHPRAPDDFVKTIFYFNTRRLARLACDLLRSLLPPHFRQLLLPFTAVNSEEYKEKVVDMMLKGDVRWSFATKALGMGLDISDIARVVVWGVDTFSDIMQEGGRAGRDTRIAAQMVWIVEPWAFVPKQSGNASGQRSKKSEREEALRLKMDPPAQEYINCSQSDRCMRIYAVDHFTPRPRLPGFPWYDPGDDGPSDEHIGSDRVLWVPYNHDLKPGPHCGCSARCCRPDPATPVGLLSVEEKHHIDAMLKQLKQSSSSATPLSVTIPPCQTLPSPPLQPSQTSQHPLIMLTSNESRPETEASTQDQAPSNTTFRTQCTKAEKESLRESLLAWRESFWAGIRKKNPFLNEEWILTSENIQRLVEKAHILVAAPTVDEALVRSIIPKNFIIGSSLTPLANLIDTFRATTIQQRAEASAAHPSKRRRDTNFDPFIDTTNSSNADSRQHHTHLFQLENYVHGL
ncbi:hypothetical protein MD484_g8898, partial [Candolleomyces efflorescens]